MNLRKLIPALFVMLVVTLPNFANNDNDKIKKNNGDDDTIVSVAASNENFTTLVAAVKAAGLVNVLNGDGPFTVFAPVNSAFGKLPKGTVESLLKPENKKTLTSILTYHVVAGKFDAKAVVGAIKANNGKFTIKTVQGGTLTASLKDGKVILTDTKGNTSTVIITDVAASNGIVHAIDTVVMP
ncbi:MAG: beta-Ig-H3/fasciclin [Flavobacteriaceae bacterium]|nr:beta-Ig-H3/fasciclin [Flavobacteriaceae bacterium]|tara:strand:- start:42213 stop:42761 length:549 start_codon:yes stop_codon:yes gene_type:complete